jgi:hypothetical protein
MTMNNGAQLDHHPTAPGAPPMTSHDALVQARLDDFQAYAAANASRHERELEAAEHDDGHLLDCPTVRDTLRVRLGRRLVELGAAVAGEPARPGRGRIA